MSYTYTVPKRKANRYAYRFLGFIFLFVVAMQGITLYHGYAKHIMITLILCTFISVYGVYLISASFRKQAFDITYRFDDSGITVFHRYGETHYDYKDVAYINIVVPDEAQIFYMLSFQAGKDVYHVPFTMKQEYCEKVYAFVNERLFKKEDEE